MPHLVLTIEYVDGPRQTHHALWARAGLPRKPVLLVRVFDGRAEWEIPSASEHAGFTEYCVVDGDPVLLFALVTATDPRGVRLVGSCWRFRSDCPPGVDQIDEPFASAALPPLGSFVPGLFREPPPRPAHRSRITAVRSRR